MPRPGPLKDLPVPKPVPEGSHISLTPFKFATKRPLSPGGAMFSPTKRRILNEEGLLSRGDSGATPTRGRLPAIDYKVPLSPARKLDFGEPLDRSKRDHDVGMATPRCRISDSQELKLAPSPEFAHHSMTPHRDISASNPFIDDDDMPAVTPLPSTSAVPLLVPRDMPSSPNRQSIHYPGFDIHRDTHIEVPSATARRCDASSSNKEDVKENLAPRRRPDKSATAPAAVSKTASTESPRAFHSGKTLTSKVPKSRTEGPTIIPAPALSTENRPSRRHISPSAIYVPAKTPRIGREQISLRKKMMESEVDDDAGELSD